MSIIMMPMMGAMDDQPVSRQGLALGDQPQAGVTPGKCSFCKTNDETTDETMQKTHDLQMRLMAP